MQFVPHATGSIDMCLTNGEMEVVIRPNHIAAALWTTVKANIDSFDDAGIDEMMTDKEGNTYIGSRDRQVCSDPRVAILVDAANLIGSPGRRLDVDDEAP